MLSKIRLNKLSLAFGVVGLMFSCSLFADRIASGEAHNLTASGNSSQSVWGANANGQLGDGTTLDSLNPIPVVDIRYNSLDGAIAVVAHGDNNLVLLDDATLLGWGPNENGQLGSGLLYSGKFLGDVPDDGDGTDPVQPIEPEPESTALVYPTEIVDPDGKPIANIITMALGTNFAAAVNQEGNVLVWGNLTAFKDREQSREPVNRFRDKFFDPNIEFIDSRYKDGDPVNNNDLMYMQDELGNRYTGIVAIAAGDNHLLALTNTGNVLAWGENSAGQLADGTLTQRPYPVYVQSSEGVNISGITSIAARVDDSAAVKSNGVLLGWGNSVVAEPVEDDSSDEESDDAISDTPEKSYAKPVIDGEGEPITGIYRVALGDSHTLAITMSRQVISWGNNSNGQLGDGTNVSVPGTAEVILSDGTPLGNIMEISVGSIHSLALRSDGKVFSWGSGENGRLGDGTNIDSYYAVNVRDSYNGPFSLF
ncbi:MAG: RCC1 domain-containing protein [Arenicellales bacterium]